MPAAIVQWIVEKLLAYLTDEVASQAIVLVLRALVSGLKALAARTPSILDDEVIAKLSAIIEDIAAKLAATK